MSDPSTLVPAAEAACTLSLAPLSMPVLGGCVLGAFLFLIPHGIFRRPEPPHPREFVRPGLLVASGFLLGAFLGHAEVRVTQETGTWLLGLVTRETFLFLVGATPVIAVMCKVTDELHAAWTARATTTPADPEVQP